MEDSDQEKTLSGKQEETPSPNTASELTGKLEITLPAIKISAQADITPSPEEQEVQAEFDLYFHVGEIDSEIKETESQIGHLFSKFAKFAIPRYIRMLDEFPRTETFRIKKGDLKSIGVTQDTFDAEV